MVDEYTKGGLKYTKGGLKYTKGGLKYTKGGLKTTYHYENQLLTRPSNRQIDTNTPIGVRARKKGFQGDVQLDSGADQTKAPKPYVSETREYSIISI